MVRITPGLCHWLLPLSVCGGLGKLQPVSVLRSSLLLNTLPSYGYTMIWAQSLTDILSFHFFSLMNNAAMTIINVWT